MNFNLDGILVMLKQMMPVLEPIGEQGIEQLFAALQAHVDGMNQNDMKDLYVVMLPAFKQFALIELRKLKGG